MKHLIRMLVIIAFSVFCVFFAYYNLNLFPEKERKQFTIKLYYQSGRVNVKIFNLPKSTRFTIVSHSSNSSLTSIWYTNKKPFGREYGYLVMGVEDFEIINIK